MGGTKGVLASQAAGGLVSIAAASAEDDADAEAFLAGMGVAFQQVEVSKRIREDWVGGCAASFGTSSATAVSSVALLPRWWWCMTALL